MTHFQSPGYDVIVVEAGSAGCALAARLSETPERSVLLLEAGSDHTKTEGFPDEILDGSVMGAAFPGHPNNWAFVGALTPELPYSIPRGRIIGGSSAINACWFDRGTLRDFERWKALGSPRWSYEHVLPFFKKLERDVDYPDSEFHGRTGPIVVTRCMHAPEHEVSAAFTSACMDLGFPHEEDKNAPGPPGVGRRPLNLVDGMRLNTAIAYLNPSRSRPNLTVQAESFVRRVICRVRKAVGVEVEQRGQVSTISGGEIVLCAGAIKSTHILMLSGIGPEEQLRKQGIEPQMNLPGVGAKFYDHPEVLVSFEPKRPLPRRPGMPIIQSGLNFTADGSEYETDLEIDAFILSIGEMMLSKRSLGATFGAVAGRARETVRAMRGVSLRRVLGQVRRRNDLHLAVLLQQEESAGRITLRSGNPYTQPVLDYNYLSTASDLNRMRQGVRLAVELLGSASFRPIVRRRTDPVDSVLKSDALLNHWLKSHLTTTIHTASSCRMGPETERTSVVDEMCRVYGIERLRVVDTSIMPYIVSRGTNATAIMMAERAAEFFQRPPLRQSEPCGRVASHAAPSLLGRLVAPNGSRPTVEEQPQIATLRVEEFEAYCAFVSNGD
jgi:choline dehydrogenase